MEHEGIQYLIELAERGGPKPEEYEKLNWTWSRIMHSVHAGDLPTELVRETWARMGEAFGSGTMQGLATRKLYGYPGDFEVIDRIYQYVICESPHIRRWDEYFQSREACQAVRNRKRYFIELLSNMSAKHGPFRVLNVGSGPARDIQEFHSLGNGHVLFDCVDMNADAIVYAKTVCADMLDRVSFHNTNIFRYRNDQFYKLIWSAGLFDYLDDRSFVILIRRLIKMVEPGGQLVVGNFSTANPTKDYMEFGEWFLTHRSRDELLALAESCQINGVTSYIGEEPQGINLFMHMEKLV